MRISFSLPRLSPTVNVGFNTSEIQEHIHLSNSLDELDIWNKTLRRLKRFAENGTSPEPIQCNALFPGNCLRTQVDDPVLRDGHFPVIDISVSIRISA